MNRKTLAGICGMTLALMLAACGSVHQVAQSFSGPCESTYYSDVLWSLDGQHIAFTARQGSGSNPSLIYVMRPDGTAVQQFSVGRRGIGSLQWLPDNQSLAYTDYGYVYTIALDGEATEFELPTQTFVIARFSPDGHSIAYSSEVLDEFGHHVSGFLSTALNDGSGNIQLISSHDEYVLGGWSPDGTRLAFTRSDGQAEAVYTIRADGSDQRKVIAGSGPLRWSTDGEWISFISAIDGSLHVIEPDGSGEKEIATNLAFDQYAWLPDSQHISFGSLDWQLKVIDLRTLSVETLAVFDFDATPPSWSPDGTQVAFIGSLHTNSLPKLQDVYIVNRDGSGQTRLTDNPGRNQCLNLHFWAAGTLFNL